MQHPPLEPFASGFVERPDGARVYWETSGNPRGRPALYLHGGPGGGLGAGGYRRRFDPDLHLIVGIDQRGCGRSEPWAADDLSSLRHQTMDDLLADIEAVRTHLGVDRWLLHGVSWGSTLALAYALEHPDRVTEIVNLAVTTGARWEIDWITDGIAPVFPEAHARLRAPLRDDERTIEGYARLLTDDSPAVRRRPETTGTPGRSPTSRSAPRQARPPARRAPAPPELRHPRDALLGERLLPPRYRVDHVPRARARRNPRRARARSTRHQRTVADPLATASRLARIPSRDRRRGRPRRPA